MNVEAISFELFNQLYLYEHEMTFWSFNLAEQP